MDTDKKFLDKTDEDLTVKDGLKYTAAVMVITTTIAFIPLGVLVLVGKVQEKKAENKRLVEEKEFYEDHKDRDL